MSKFSNFKIKWLKSVEYFENGYRLDPLRQNLDPQNGSLDPPVVAPYIYGVPVTIVKRGRSGDFNWVPHHR